MRRAVVVLCVLGLLAALPGIPAASASDTDRGPGPAFEATRNRYAAQPVDWSECYPGGGTPEFQCATIHVPEDWANPRRGDIGLLITKIAATDPAHRHGSLLINFGGPGIPSYYAPQVMTETEPGVAATYDLIGFDPRGVGNSTALECADPAILDEAYALDGLDASPANTAKFPRLSRQYGQTCSRSPHTRFITTAQTVRDMDLIRALLHERKISYLGYSAGTWLGAWYAATFPSQTDRFVFDGNEEWTNNWYTGLSRQAAAFQRDLEQEFIPWLARYDAVYHLGATPAQVTATLAARRAALQANPIELAPGNLINGAAYDFGIGGGFYSSSFFTDIGVALSALEHWSTATPEEQATVATWFYGGTIGHNDDPFWAILCGDTPNPSPSVAVGDWLRDRFRYPLVGSTFIYPCAYWATPPTGSPVVGKNLPPVLMLANDHDPATPYEGALRAHRATPSSRLVTVRHEGGHTVYGGGLTCVEDVVNAYFVDGVMPRRDVTCAHGFPLPDPTATAAAARTFAAPSAPTGLTPYLRARLVEAQKHR